MENPKLIKDLGTQYPTLKSKKKARYGIFQCPYCNKEYSKMGIATHIWRSHGSGKSHNPNKGYIDNNRKVWNKNETKFTNKCILKQS